MSLRERDDTRNIPDIYLFASIYVNALPSQNADPSVRFQQEAQVFWSQGKPIGNGFLLNADR